MHAKHGCRRRNGTFGFISVVSRLRVSAGYVVHSVVGLRGIGGILRRLRRIQQLVLGMVIRRIGCLPKHAGKIGGRNHILHLTQPRVQVG